MSSRSEPTVRFLRSLNKERAREPTPFVAVMRNDLPPIVTGEHLVPTATAEAKYVYHRRGSPSWTSKSTTMSSLPQQSETLVMQKLHERSKVLCFRAAAFA